MGCCGSRGSTSGVHSDTALLSGTALFRARPLPVAWSQVRVTGYPLHCRSKPPVNNPDSGTDPEPRQEKEREQRPTLFGVPDGAEEDQREGMDRDSAIGSAVSDRSSGGPPRDFDDLPTLVLQERWMLSDTLSLEALPPPTPYLRGLDLDDDLSLEVPDETRPGDDSDTCSVDVAREVLAQSAA